MFFDKIIVQIDHAINTLFINQTSDRKTPGDGMPEPEMSPKERSIVVGLLRVNHCGEVCAQALYYGQSMLVKNIEYKQTLELAAQEELDHLVWLQNRLHDLNGKPSVLDPLFYAYSFSMGIAVSLLGNSWNFAFIHETEQQVLKHLNKHIRLLPVQDQKSLKTLEQMAEDEEKHSMMALNIGHKTMPEFAAKCMQTIAKVMTKTTYYI